jgi:hypothetical protein
MFSEQESEYINFGNEDFIRPRMLRRSPHFVAPPTFRYSQLDNNHKFNYYYLRLFVATTIQLLVSLGLAGALWDAVLDTKAPVRDSRLGS